MLNTNTSRRIGVHKFNSHRFSGNIMGLINGHLYHWTLEVFRLYHIFLTLRRNKMHLNCFYKAQSRAVKHTPTSILGLAVIGSDLLRSSVNKMLSKDGEEDRNGQLDTVSISTNKVRTKKKHCRFIKQVKNNLFQTSDSIYVGAVYMLFIAIYFF